MTFASRALCVCLACWAVCGKAAAAGPAAPERVADEESTRLRVGVYEFAPLVSLDPAGKPRGLYIDLLEHVARQEGWRLEYVPSTWHECLRALDEARVDLVPVVGYSEQRARKLAFTSEFPVLDWGVVYAPERSSIHTVFDLRGKRVGALRGSIYTQGFRTLIEQFGIDLTLVEKDDYDSVFRAVGRGELDAGIDAQISGAGLAPRHRLEATQIYFSPIRLGYAAPKTRSALVRTLDAHFAALRGQPGSVWHEILARWMPGRSPPQPRWVVPLLASGGVLLLLSVGFTWILRRRVVVGKEALRAANAHLSESQALLRTFSDAMPDPIFIKDREGRWLFANPATLATVGRPLEAVLGKTDPEIWSDAGVAAALVRSEQRVMATGTPEVIEERFQTPAGERVYLVTKVPYRGEDGRVVGIVGSGRDITERTRAEERLRESEHRFRALTERASDVILVTDGEGVITFASSSLARAVGIAPESAVGASYFDAVHPDDVERMRRSFASVRTAPGSRREDELRIRRADGGFALMRAETRNLLDDPSVRGIVVNSRDVTEQRAAEEKLRQAQKLESIGRLAGGVAHDFNNLLTVILSCAASLAEEVRAGSRASADEIEEIRTAGRRAADLTRQLLAFARKQIIAPVPLDLSDVVHGSEQLLRRVLGEDVELVVNLQPGLWYASCDPSQLEQVILNLAVNARDAMPRGGTLTIETRNVEFGVHDAEQEPDRRPGQWVRLTVRDIGSGMSDEVKRHLFEPFFTTKPTGEGTGLGLATVYGIVRQSGGHLHVKSELGRGTTFEICLPRTCERPPEGRAAVARPAAHGTETLLVVEDEAPVREVTVRSLRRSGYTVLVAASGREALALDAEELGRARLLVTDVVMPGMDGRELADELRRRYPRLEVLFVSGYAQDAIGRRGVLDDGVEFLPKPFTPTALLAQVRTLLDRGERRCGTARPG